MRDKVKGKSGRQGETGRRKVSPGERMGHWLKVSPEGCWDVSQGVHHGRGAQERCDGALAGRGRVARAR